MKIDLSINQSRVKINSIKKEFMEFPGFISVTYFMAAGLISFMTYLSASQLGFTAGTINYLPAEQVPPMERKLNQDLAIKEFNKMFRTDLSYQELTNNLPQLGYTPSTLTNLLNPSN
ncbi:MAG: hypothetical protein AABX11_00725 [Nanoarchaeota archaeon]